MIKALYFFIVFIPILLSSCIQFPVISTLTTASSLDKEELMFKVGNSGRNIHLQLRKGIYKEDFWGLDSGIFVSYGFPDRLFNSLSFSFDTKLSIFENSKNVFATGVEVNYLLVEITDQQMNLLENSVNLSFPIYLESSMTEWFRFLVNFRLFFKVFSFEKSLYSFPLVSINVGVEFFRTLRLEGYLLAGEGVKAFPIPGISISYVLKF